MSQGMWSDCVGDSTSTNTMLSCALPSRVSRAAAVKTRQNDRGQMLPQSSSETIGVGARAANSNIFDEPQAKAVQLPVPSPLMSRDKPAGAVATGPDNERSQEAPVQQTRVDQPPEPEPNQASLVEEQTPQTQKLQTGWSNNAQQGWALSTPATQWSPETAAASSPPQISPPKLEQLTQQLSTLERQQRQDEERQTGMHETRRSPPPAQQQQQQQQPAISLIRQLSQRLERLQRRPSSGAEEQLVARAEGMVTPARSEAAFDEHSGQRDDGRQGQEEPSSSASPAEPLGLALLSHDTASSADSEKRSPARFLRHITQRLENLQLRNSPPPSTPSEAESRSAAAATAAAAAALAASTVFPPAPEPEQRQQPLRQPSPQISPPQLQQLSARLGDHYLQQHLRGKAPATSTAVPPQQQTPPQHSPKKHSESQGHEGLAPAPPAWVSEGHEESSNFSLSPDRQGSPQISPPILYQLSQRLEPSEGTLERLQQGGVPMIAKAAPAIQEGQLMLAEPKQQGDQEAESLGHQSEPQTPQTESQPQLSASPQYVSPQAISPSTGPSSGASSEGPSPQEIAQPKFGLPMHPHPRPRNGPRVLPSPEQFASRRLLQLPPPQPNQAANQLRVTEQSKAELPRETVLPQQSKPLGHEEQKLRQQEVKAEEQGRVGAGALMPQMQDALLHVEQSALPQLGQPQDMSGLSRDGSVAVPTQTEAAAVPEIAEVDPRVDEIAPKAGEAELQSSSQGQSKQTTTEEAQQQEQPQQPQQPQQHHQQQQQQQQSVPDFERSPWAFGAEEAENRALEATKLALALCAEEASAAEAAVAAAVSLFFLFSAECVQCRRLTVSPLFLAQGNPNVWIALLSRSKVVRHDAVLMGGGCGVVM